MTLSLQGSRTGASVLIVDDDDAIRMTLSASLEIEGFEVTEAENAEAALRALDERTFDIVLSDVRMPGMNGVDLFRVIREKRPGLPVVLMTGYALEALVRQAIEGGVFTVLSKPFDVGEVVGTLARASRGPLVLVVDEADDAEATATVLRDAGVKAVAESTPERAFELVSTGAVDVCVVDLAEPERTPKMLARLRDEAPSAVCIAVAGTHVAESVRRAAAKEALACLRKPVSHDELLQWIARARAGERPR